MENLLASIRQAIDNDLGDVRRAVTSSGAVKGSMNEMRVRVEPARAQGITEEINALRSKIGTNRQPPEFRPEKVKTPFAQIMAGEAKTPHIPQPLVQRAQPMAEMVRYEAEVDPEPEPWPEQALLPAPANDDDYETYEDATLLSDEAAEQANASFNELSEALMARALGQRSIEDMTLELLRSMLSNWLDQNLPSMVERLVREEIERVGRRGR
jgi:uncharacterized protein